MNQRVARTGYVGGVKFWAWTVSVGVHLAILTGFVVAEFSHSQERVSGRSFAVVKVSQREVFARAPVVGKPKIKRPEESFFTRRERELFSAERIFGSTRPRVVDLPELVKPSAGQGVFSLGGGMNSMQGVEFFGSFTECRKVCYVVDCSGSMRGMFGKVREKLAESIERLEADQYFYIIFFGGGRLFEFGDGRLVRATEQSKGAAYSFIESVQPSGQTNATEALERAVQVRDAGGARVSSVYFLTDGFELSSEDARLFSQKVGSLLSRYAPETRVDTIGFWPQSKDRAMLEAIASQSGGRAVFIESL